MPVAPTQDFQLIPLIFRQALNGMGQTQVTQTGGSGHSSQSVGYPYPPPSAQLQMGCVYEGSGG